MGAMGVKTVKVETPPAIKNRTGLQSLQADTTHTQKKSMQSHTFYIILKQ